MGPLYELLADARIFRTRCKDHINATPFEFRQERRYSLVIPLYPPHLKRDILPLYVATFCEILLRLHNHPKFGALLGYRADKMHGAPMLEITTTLTRNEILEAFASTFDTHVMAQSLRPVPLEENDGERDYDVEFLETHQRLPRPARFCLMDCVLQEYPFFAFDESHRLVTPVGVTTTLRRADSDAVAH